MSSFSIMNVSAVSRPYEWGFATPRGPSDLMWDFWNGATASARVATLDGAGRLRVGDGAAATPAFAFVSDPDTGMYQGSDNWISFALGGVKIVDLSPGTGSGAELHMTGAIEATGDLTIGGNASIDGTLKVDDVTYPGELAQGDILYASAANTLSRLAKGTNGQQLVMGATVPAWADAPGAPTIPQPRLAGNGLLLAGNTLSINRDGSTLEVSGSGLKVADSFVATRNAVTTMADNDNVLVSDESRTNKDRKITFANLRSALNIPAATPAFTVHGVAAAATPETNDRFVFSDEGESGDPNKYVTFTNLRTAVLAGHRAGPAESSTAQVTAGTDGTTYISPRRLEGRLTAFFR